jgi:hypothetical protein
LQGFTQKKFDFSFWEDSLVNLRNEVMNAATETDKLVLNEDFMNLLESILQEPNSFNYAWNKCINFSVISSEDHLFKIFTWFVEKEDYTVENWGFLQIYNENRKKYVIFSLYDQKQSLESPNEEITDHNGWYGAIYYKIIPLQTKTKTYYTLLGWNGNNLFSQQKIIEILHFKKDMTPQFGAKIFKNVAQNKATRIIFEYSKNSSFSLKYERQAYPVNTGKRDLKTKKIIYETVADNVIIFDKLIPVDESMSYITAFSVSESSLNQGFVEENGKWNFLPDVFGAGADLPPNKYKKTNHTFYKQE